MHTRTVESFNHFVTNWARGMYRGLRYGQAFCNVFGIQDTELYYEVDPGKAAGRIGEYVENWQL